MRIAQVAPLYESVPPKLYGGTERVVSYLTEELVRRGHEVTLFASGDSDTRARLVAASPRSLRLDPACVDDLVHHLHMLELVRRRSRSFDVLHFHLEYMHLPMARAQPTPHLTTMHGRLDLPGYAAFFEQMSGAPLVSISHAQRGPLSWCNWQATVHHGLPLGTYAPRDGAGGYLLFVGRISPEKRVDRAVELARRTGLRLVVAAKIAEKDKVYFESVQHLLREPFVDFIGEVGDDEKGGLYGDARALVFPIDWPEPFGLVMVEAMLCGAPVIAWRGGSVDEIVDVGVTGFVVDSVAEAEAAVAQLDQIDRRGCAERARERFSASRMVDDYLTVYDRLLARRQASTSPVA